MCDVVAEFKKPVMIYSIGRDSSVLLQVAVKAFHPAKLPSPLAHTIWKFPAYGWAPHSTAEFGKRSRVRSQVHAAGNFSEEAAAEKHMAQLQHKM